MRTRARWPLGSITISDAAGAAGLAAELVSI
jgi:hypothetical protein